ncbi:MAG: hypothetical protein IIY58_02845 [Aeriscardovia sp.]|nr:hypothetical protein [Aeriscardovia sp.]
MADAGMGDVGISDVTSSKAAFGADSSGSPVLLRYIKNLSPFRYAVLHLL